MTKHNYLVAGAGKMARAVVCFLNKQKDTGIIYIFDNNSDNLNYFKKNYKKIKVFKKDIKKIRSFNSITKDASVVISCLPYYFNLKLTELSIKAGFSFVDLGGNNDVVKAQHKLHSKAKKKQLRIVPDCGLAPGLVSILTAYYVDYFEKVKSVRIFVGGLPDAPEPPLNYKLVFSISGLINEYIEDAIILQNGRIKKVSSLTGLEDVKVKGEYYEAFYTSGGISTMPGNFKGKIKELEYKTLRYPWHCVKIKMMKDLGFFKPENREFSEKILEKALYEKDVKDIIVLKVIARGYRNRKLISKTTELVDHYDKRSKLTAMMRMTGFPAAATAVLIAREKVPNAGVLFNELDIPFSEILRMLKVHNIQFSGIKVV